LRSYTAYTSPRWIEGISKYAHGSGTAVLRLDPCTECPNGVLITLREVLYVPGLRDHSGQPIRLFSPSMAQFHQPELVVSLTQGSNFMGLPDGAHIFLREGNGLLYLDCTTTHDQRSDFAGFTHKSPIAKGVVTLSSPPSVPSVATDKGDFGRVLGHQPPLDLRTFPEISGFSASSASKFAENLVEFQNTPGTFPQPSLTHGAPIATFPISFMEFWLVQPLLMSWYFQHFPDPWYTSTLYQQHPTIRLPLDLKSPI
jgi:hypothetical protein